MTVTPKMSDTKASASLKDPSSIEEEEEEVSTPPPTLDDPTLMASAPPVALLIRQKEWTFKTQIPKEDVPRYMEEEQVSLRSKIKEQRRERVHLYQCTKKKRHRCEYQVKVVEPRIGSEATVYYWSAHNHDNFFRGLTSEQREIVDLARRYGGGTSQARDMMIDNGIEVPPARMIHNHMQMLIKKELQMTDPEAYELKYGKYYKKKSENPDPWSTAEQSEKRKRSAAVGITSFKDEADGSYSEAKQRKVGPRFAGTWFDKMQADLMQSELERSRMEKEKLGLEIRYFRMKCAKLEMEMNLIQTNEIIDHQQPEGHIINNGDNVLVVNDGQLQYIRSGDHEGNYEETPT